MKKIHILCSSLVILILMTIYGSCRKQEVGKKLSEKNLVIENFLKSNTFLRHKSFINSFGKLNQMQIYKDSPSDTDMSSKEYFVFNLSVQKNNKLIGVLQVAEINNNLTILPNDDKYALNYIDLSKYDAASNTGFVKMYDLNYDNIQHTSLYVRNNVIQKDQITSLGLSELILEKYKDINIQTANNKVSYKSKIMLSVVTDRETSSGIYKLCDENKDKNISFAECYKCASDAIKSDGFANFICEMAVVSGLLIGPELAAGGSCIVSKAAACIVVSSMY